MLVTMRRPRLSVRSRLTGLYGLMFVLSGALLLAIAGGVTISKSAREVQSVNAHPVIPVATALRQAQPASTSFSFRSILSRIPRSRIS